MSDNASAGGKAAPAKDDTDTTDNQPQNGPSMASAPQRDSGYEKFANVGGSGGAPGAGKQGYEHLAEH